MSDMGTAPGADHGWLAKVLAGDRLVRGVLDLVRTLPDAEWDAFASRVEQITAPPRERGQEPA